MSEIFGHPWMKLPCANIQEVKSFFDKRADDLFAQRLENQTQLRSMSVAFRGVRPMSMRQLGGGLKNMPVHDPDCPSMTEFRTIYAP